MHNPHLKSGSSFATLWIANGFYGPGGIQTQLLEKVASKVQTLLRKVWNLYILIININGGTAEIQTQLLEKVASKVQTLLRKVWNLYILIININGGTAEI